VRDYAKQLGGNAVQLQVRIEQRELVMEATGGLADPRIREGKTTPPVATSSNEFTANEEITSGSLSSGMRQAKSLGSS
jgi:hypothetical protein